MLILIFNVELKSLFNQSLSEQDDFMVTSYTISKKLWIGMIFSDQFRKIIMRHKRIGYDLNVRRQYACLVINPITVDNVAALFNCTPVDRASDSIIAPT